MAKKFVKAMDSQHFGEGRKEEPDLTLFPLNEHYITYKLVGLMDVYIRVPTFTPNFCFQGAQ